jgi:tetrahydromethanopterin S-methyltransferase subunit C
MGRSFSLATLNLAMAIVAVALASTRIAMSRGWTAGAESIGILQVSGGLCGLMLGIVLAIWNRPGQMRSWGLIFGGFVLGALTAAQLTVKVDWPVIFATPIILIATVFVVAANRRRRRSIRPEIFDRPVRQAATVTPERD